jgi:hypothetical protein
MPHRRANPLVPHLLTVRVTFNYNDIGYNCAQDDVAKFSHLDAKGLG